MAEDRSVGGIYLRLGLNLSELETGFVTASQTVAANISRLNRESNLIRIRSEVEIAGLDETADAERILEIRQNALNQQLAIQRDRVRILNAEFQNLVRTQGENSVTAQRAALTLERQRLALANLERELQNLNSSTDESTSSFGDLNSLLPEIPTRLQAIGMAAGALATGISFASDATKEMIEDFRELQQQAYELNMSVNDTEQFLRELALAGGDIGDFEGYIRGITDAFVKGEYDDPEFIALRKYGAEITDATGRLKNFKEISEEVYQAWLKADAAGEGIEFLQLTGGESGIRDAIQLFERLKEAREDAEKIYDANLDSDELHELDRALKLTEEQAEELKNAIGNIFTPAVQAMEEKFFSALHDGTEFLVENKEEFQRWGFIVTEIFDELAPKIEKLFPSGQLKEVINSFSAIKKEIESFSDSAGKIDFGDEKLNAAFAKLKADTEKFNLESPISKIWDNIFDSDIVKNNPIAGAIKRAEQAQSEYNSELAGTKTVTDTVEKGFKALSEQTKEFGDVLSQYGAQRVKQFKDEIEDIQLEIDFGDNDYQKAIEELELWRKRELTDKLMVSSEEEKAIQELYETRKKLIDQERDDKLADIRTTVDAEFKSSIENRIDAINAEKDAWLKAGMEEAEATELAQRRIAKAYEEAAERVQNHYRNAADIQYEMTHSAFEKELRDIEIWKDEQLKKAEVAGEVASIIAESAAKESQAFEREVDRIKGKMQTLDDKIFEQEHSQYENDLRRLQQERIKLYEEGMPTEKIERYYQNEIKKLNQRASKDKEYRKPPMDNSMERGGNGIMVIGGDKIIDDGLAERREEIRLLVDENQIRAQMLQNLADKGLNAPTEIQAMQNLPDMQKYFSALPQGNHPQYDLSALNMLQEMKPPETTIQIETLVTPLNNIASIAGNILSAMNNRQQPSLTLSPNMAINLGGAYVFDEKMKKTLVDDITDEVVTAIKEAVQTATSRANYSYGA